MGIAASYIARLLHRHRWIAYAGLLLILYVAVEMIYRGIDEVWPLISHSCIELEYGIIDRGAV